MKNSSLKFFLTAICAAVWVSSFYIRAANSTPALGPPGSLISFSPIAPPPGASAWKIRYVSTGLDGKPIEVSGVVIAPDSPGANRPVIAYAHGTTGITDACAPSARDPKFKLLTGLQDMIGHGFVVAATDYPA